MIAVSGIRIPLEATAAEAAEAACTLLKIPRGAVTDYKLRRVSYDARHGKLSIVCSVLLTLNNEGTERSLCASVPFVSLIKREPLTVRQGTIKLNSRPVVAGFGPAGIFAAYLLSLYGYRPIVAERGGSLEERVTAVEGFFHGGALDTQNNVQFGEGGAGTFSDGKLTTRINDPLCDFVTDTFLKFGAPEDIAVKAKPHIGTDKLRTVVARLREAIIENGGEIRFHTTLEGLEIKNGRLCSVTFNGERLNAEALIIACGHSARDTFGVLHRAGLELTAKPFSVGARIEHLQSEVNRALYGEQYQNPLLPNAEYNFSAHCGTRGVYTFCMCPGGVVVPAASEEGGVVTNGMSSYARDGKNANSALVVSVGEKEFGTNPFDAISYQRRIEAAAFTATKGDYKAPACDVKSFLEGKAALNLKDVQPSYERGVAPASFDEILGKETADAMRYGIAEFSKMAAFWRNGGAVLTGAETRTSSPVRILREETRHAKNAYGVYPCGEGAGYAGGIMSAAVDGIKTALAVMKEWKAD